MPNLSAQEFFDAELLEETADYARFVRIVTVLSIVATLITLVVLVYRIPRLARATGLGPIGSGMIVAMVMLVVVWAVDLPFSIALRWWDTRHDLAEGGWLEWLIEPWAVLGGSIAFIMLQVAIVMGFARRYPRFWWIPVPPVFLAITVFFIFVSPYLLAFGIDRPADPQLRRESQVLAKKVGAEGTPVDVEKVSDVTNQPNAFAAYRADQAHRPLRHAARRPLQRRLGGGGRRARVRAHRAQAHSEGAWVVGAPRLPDRLPHCGGDPATWGLGDPAVLPYGALVLVVINLALMPFANEISCRYESEADWVALKATNDPAAAESLFEGFAKEGSASRIRPGGGTSTSDPIPRFCSASRWPRPGSGASADARDLRDDVDRRAEPDARAKAENVAVCHAHAAVGDSLAKKVWLVRSVDPDDAAAGPLRELRVCARLQRKLAEHRHTRDQLPRDVEEATWRLHARAADCHSRLQDQAPLAPELESPRAEVDVDELADRAEIRSLGRDPTRSSVRPPRQADSVPARGAAS